MLYLQLLKLCCRNSILIKEFGLVDDERNHVMHALGGMILILISNCLVIIGIYCNVHFFLIPWLFIYLMGKCYFGQPFMLIIIIGFIILTIMTLMDLHNTFSILMVMLSIIHMIIWRIIKQILGVLRSCQGYKMVLKLSGGCCGDIFWGS